MPWLLVVLYAPTEIWMKMKARKYKVSLPLVDRKDSNRHCQDWKTLPTTLSLWISRHAMLKIRVQLWTTPQAIIQVQSGINQYSQIYRGKYNRASKIIIQLCEKEGHKNFSYKLNVINNHLYYTTKNIFQSNNFFAL